MKPVILNNINSFYAGVLHNNFCFQNRIIFLLNLLYNTLNPLSENRDLPVAICYYEEANINDDIYGDRIYM